MTIEQLYKHYKTWTAVALALGVQQSNVLYWRKRGYIPYSTQLVIQERTKGLFKADEKHAKTRIRGRPPEKD